MLSLSNAGWHFLAANRAFIVLDSFSVAHTRYLKCSTATFKMLSFPNLNPDWMSTYYYIAALHHFVDRKIYTLPKANEQYDDYLAGHLVTLDTTNINKQRLQATGFF